MAKKKVGLIVAGIALILVPVALGVWYLYHKPGTATPGNGTMSDAEIQQMEKDAEMVSGGRG